MDYSPSGSFVHGISQARILEQVVISSSRNLPYPGIKHTSPALSGGFSSTEPSGKPHSSYNWMEIIPLLNILQLLNLSVSPGSCQNPQWYRLVMNLSTLVHSGPMSIELEEGWREIVSPKFIIHKIHQSCMKKSKIYSQTCRNCNSHIPFLKKSSSRFNSSQQHPPAPKKENTELMNKNIPIWTNPGQGYYLQLKS